MGDTIRQRTAMAQTAFALTALFTLYALLITRRALTSSHRTGKHYDLLGHTDGAAADKLSSASSAGELSGMRCFVLLLCGVLAVAVLYAQSIIPEAAPGMWLHGLWLMSAALIVCSVVGFCLIVGRTVNAGKRADHEH